uniref:NADPH oxidase n=1 Tax=Strongylocentrotus purpuratus TaxID=7668 RepID=Q2TPT8_STRPU|nr:NADPH oxidase [Strongylocentrotus purpuratus]AAW22991.1 NADPH oxidase [Strongylocentrotus purpuratus]
MGDKFLNEGLKYFFLLLWLAANVAYWVVTFLVYEQGPQYFYIRRITGVGLSIAKAAGAALNLNSMIILLPICRNLISFFRGSCATNTLCRRSVRRQLDKNLTFHKTVAYMIVVWTIVHVVAHAFNFRNLYNHYRCVTTDNDELCEGISAIGRKFKAKPEDNWLNPIQGAKTLPAGLGLIEQALIPIAGWSGAVLTLALILMFSSATEFIRRSYFETFWITHHLFIVYFAMLLAHGVGGIIRSQTNLDRHDVVFCSENLDVWGPTSAQCEDPVFKDGSAASYKWVSGPLFIYLLERTIRFWRSCQTVTLTKVVKHQSKVIELQMKKKGFKMEAGQYIFLKCPSISHVQWHPFTLTSAPEEDHFSVHIRVVGDWTRDLFKAMGADKPEQQSQDELARVAVDGPFGTASIDIFKYQVAICVGAGIGVTPFASILKSIWLKSVNNSASLKLKKVYFFWICPDTNAFEWFSTLLDSIDTHFTEQGKPDFLKYYIYLSRGWNNTQAKNIYLQEEQEIDAITGLRQKTHYGRPKWDSNFKMIAEENPGRVSSVFFCGPKALSSVLHENANKFTSLTPDGAKFFYNKENF